MTFDYQETNVEDDTDEFDWDQLEKDKKKLLEQFCVSQSKRSSSSILKERRSTRQNMTNQSARVHQSLEDTSFVFNPTKDNGVLAVGLAGSHLIPSKTSMET